MPSTPPRIGIVGSRRWPDATYVVAVVAGLPADAVVVSGGCRTGPDRWAADAAKVRGLDLVEYLPDFSGAKTRFAVTECYYRRNQQIADDIDTLIAFVMPDRKGGTEDTIRRAERRGVPVKIYAADLTTPPPGNQLPLI